jgi:hypothetical protein
MTTGKAIKSVPMVALVALGAVTVPAVSHAAEIRPAIVAGFDTGGDNLISVPFTNGETASIKANELFYIGAGASVVNDEKNIEFLGTVNYKFAAISASNGDVDWTSVPLNALLFYRMQNFRVGAGLVYVMNPKLSGSGVASGVNVNFDDALGFLVQADYLLGKVAIGVRGTFVDYKAGGRTFKGDGVGITFGFTF